MSLRVLFTFVIFLASPSSYANATLERIFKATFNDPNIYQEGHCRENIARLAKLAIAEGVDPKTLTTIEMMPLGDLWVNKARNYNNRINPYGRRAYFYHVVLSDGKMIYDYDFLDRATPIAIKNYFEEMLMNEYYHTNSSECIRQIGWTTLRFQSHIGKPEHETRLKDTGWVCR